MEPKKNKLTNLFLDELFQSALTKQNILESVVHHMEYKYVPKELQAYKHILKAIKEWVGIHKVTPTIGAISQQYESNTDVQETLLRIKETKLPSDEIILSKFESYIKQSRFEELYEKVAELYDSGDKEEAIKIMAEESSKIHEMSIRVTAGKFHKIFENFFDGVEEDAISSMSNENGAKITFGIDEIDELCAGGISEGETALWILPSGGGKSTVLRHHGYAAALAGFNVLHIQAEGGLKPCRQKYNQIWTRLSFKQLSAGEIPAESESKIKKTIRVMSKRGSDIAVYAYEEFGLASMKNTRDRVMEYRKINGFYPDLIIIDSLDLFVTGLNKKLDTDPEMLKYRMKEVARQMSNLAIETKSRVITSTQASNIPQEKLDDPKFNISRNNTEGDRTLIQPFSFCFTFNRTRTESKMNEGRIFCDKIRHYKAPADSLKIGTNYDKGIFYSRAKTAKVNQRKMDAETEV